MKRWLAAMAISVAAGTAIGVVLGRRAGRPSDDFVQYVAVPEAPALLLRDEILERLNEPGRWDDCCR